MKKLIFLSMLLALFACRKEGLDVKFRTIYTSPLKTKSAETTGQIMDSEQDYYSQFGDFLGTITPDSVTALFKTIRFTDSKTLENGVTTLIDVVSPNYDISDPRCFADFTNGNIVEVIPEMYGNIGNDGWFVAEKIDLKYLGVFLHYMLFYYDLPPMYNNVDLMMDHYRNGMGYMSPPGFTDAALRNENKMESTNFYFLQHEYKGLGRGPRSFVFGGTDSSYVVSAQNFPPGEVASLVRMGIGDVARVGNYTNEILTHPGKGKQKVISTTISFNYDQIIQYYAGRDNIPFTYDDVFVLVPHFWNRFNIDLKQN